MPRTQRGVIGKTLRALVIGVAILAALVVLAAVEWVAYAGHARLQREVKTPEQLDAGQGRWITAAGARLHLREWGPAGAPTLLLIHGTGGWSGAWLTLPDVLSEAGWRVVALDLPPFGLSTLQQNAASAAPDYTRNAQAARILAVIDQLGAPVTLVAHSFGSGPSLEAALHAEGRLRQLVLVDPALGLGPNGEAPVCEPPGAEVSWLLARRPLRSALIAATATWPGFTTALLRSFVYKKDTMTEATVARFQRPFERAGFTPQLGDYVAGFVRGSCEAADSLDLAKVAAWAANGPPVALVWGQRDSITPIAQAAALKRLMPGATLTVLPGVGHIPHVESPGEFATALLGALRR
ncbi:MAG TPA: alpha/beta hydrolase [Burkholderiaceae bacterium]|jgi:pimeloyl-ACP methyl ester carboxylesterase